VFALQKVTQHTLVLMKVNFFVASFWVALWAGIWDSIFLGMYLTFVDLFQCVSLLVALSCISFQINN